MAKLPVAVLISGRGSNLEALIRAEKQEQFGAAIAVVLSDRADARGLEIARANGIPTVVVPRQPKTQTNEEFNTQLITALRPYSPRLAVLAGFMRIISRSFIAAFDGAVINIHPALLPSFPGVEAQRQALEAGVRISGCTVHYVTPDVDGGPIIAQCAVAVALSDTAASLAARILREEHRLLPAVVSAIAQGTVKLINGAVSLSPELALAEGSLSNIRLPEITA